MRDQLVKIIASEVVGRTASSGARLAADAIIAALPDMVQPLVWMRNGSHYAGGHGYVVRKFGGVYIMTCRNKFEQEFNTLEAAKAAAQADYTRRILSAFGIAGDT